MARTSERRALVPLLAVSVVVVLVAVGLSRGLWLTNLHNGLLGVAFTFVGASVLYHRPGHRVGWLFLATGVVEAVMFLGRQLGRAPDSTGDRWWGWLGVWPLAIGLALTTFSVVCFPDGRLPSPRWRWVAAGVVAVSAVCAGLSALWPVEYAAAGVVTPHPFDLPGVAVADAVWSRLAHPAYAALQVLWVVAVLVRWRSADGVVRRQLATLALPAGLSVLALGIGLVGWGTPTAGVLSAVLVPVVAGWSIVQGRHLATYAALTWLSGPGGAATDRTSALARAVAAAVQAPAATVWMGDDSRLHAVGVWPAGDDDVASTDYAALFATRDLQVRLVRSGDTTIGALSVQQTDGDRLSSGEERLLDDLTAQAVLVLENLSLAALVADERRAGHLDGLTPRERDVLELMARGYSNAAICAELHLSVKTVEPVVGAIFTKLGLHPEATSNRRVLAVLAYLRT